jgi:hypothetical protein
MSVKEPDTVSVCQCHRGGSRSQVLEKALDTARSDEYELGGEPMHDLISLWQSPGQEHEVVSPSMPCLLAAGDSVLTVEDEERLVHLLVDVQRH